MDRSSAYEARVSWSLVESLQHQFNRVGLEALPFNYIRAISYYQQFVRMGYTAGDCWELTVCKIFDVPIMVTENSERKKAS